MTGAVLGGIRAVAGWLLVVAGWLSVIAGWLLVVAGWSPDPADQEGIGFVLSDVGVPAGRGAEFSTIGVVGMVKAE